MGVLVTTGRTVHLCNHFGTPSHNIYCSSTPIFQRDINVPKHIYKNVYSRVVHNISQWDSTQCSSKVDFGKYNRSFPDSAAGKESAYPPVMQETLVQFLGQDDPEEGIGYPFQYSWASLVPQMVKNPTAMEETWVWPLGWKDPLEKRKAAHSSILA